MMTSEVVVLLAIYTTVLMAVVISGPKRTFDEAAPQLAAKIERNIATGRGFTQQ